MSTLSFLSASIIVFATNNDLPDCDSPAMVEIRPTGNPLYIEPDNTRFIAYDPVDKYFWCPYCLEKKDERIYTSVFDE